MMEPYLAIWGGLALLALLLMALGTSLDGKTGHFLVFLGLFPFLPLILLGTTLWRYAASIINKNKNA